MLVSCVHGLSFRMEVRVEGVECRRGVGETLDILGLVGRVNFQTEDE